MQPKTLRRSLSLLIALTALVVLAAAAYTPGSGAAPRQAPCTKSALSAGLKHGPDATPEGRIIKPFACAGQYAYAAVLIPKVEITVVFRATGNRWITVDRTNACKGNKIPSNIYKEACETN